MITCELYIYLMCLRAAGKIHNYQLKSFTMTVLSPLAVNMSAWSGARHRWVHDFEYLYVSQRDQ